MTRRALAALLPALALAGCDNTLTGQPLGKPFVVAKAIARSSRAAASSSYTVVFSDQSGDLACAAADAGTPANDGTQKMLIVLTAAGDQLPATGEYTQSGADASSVVFACTVTDGLCRLAQAFTSSVTLTTATEKRVSGKFSAELVSGRPFSGTFGVDLCP